MLDLKASRFYHAALQSGLIDAAGLETCFEAIPPEKRTHDAVDRRLARQVIAAGKMTLWQAQQVLGGRASGFRIDKYLLLDLLGRGGMGRVYLARDTRLNRNVALKILSQERMNNPRAIARFQREAKVGAQLQHENLVRVYDEGDDDGVRFLVMEYIEGKNVGQVIAELGAIPWSTTAKLGRQVALGLDHARLKGLIHRDVNPCNILITRDGSAKLTDLGLAIDLADQDNVTRDGATVGTFDYVSPEQARHSRLVDTRADIYSLGCTLYHMIAGRVPFPVVSLPEKLYAHQLHEPEPLSELVPGVPRGLDEAIRRMMRKSPDDRFQTPLEVAEALEPFANEAAWAASSVAKAAAEERGDVGADTKLPPAPSEDLGNGQPSSWATALNIDLGPDPSDIPMSGRRILENAAKPTEQIPDSIFPLGPGPDDTLREGLNPSRTRSANPDPEPVRRRKRLVLLGAGAAAGVLVLGGVTLLASLALSEPDGSALPRGNSASKGVAKPLAEGEVVVLFRNGESTAASSLRDAIAMSVRDRAEVVLTKSTTLKLSNDLPRIHVPDGGLTIRAADGAKPVIEITMKRAESILFANAKVRFIGLKVVVRYEVATDAPVFRAERDLTLERCVFQATGSAAASRLAAIEGPRVAVKGCLFDGFELALDLAANPGMTTTIENSIFVAARASEEPTGRALHIRSTLGSGTACKLNVDCCSTRASTFLDAARFTSESPLAVEVSGSAFLVKTLVAYEGDSKTPIGRDGGVSPRAPLLWSGRENLYQVAGPAWAALAGPEPMPDPPANLEAWSKLAREGGSKLQALSLAKDPPETPDPRDCVLLTDGGKPAGADPSRVGPQ
jgi:serine/threonine protein kinase